jgi:hypothetical protein
MGLFMSCLFKKHDLKTSTFQSDLDHWLWHAIPPALRRCESWEAANFVTTAVVLQKNPENFGNYG